MKEHPQEHSSTVLQPYRCSPGRQGPSSAVGAISDWVAAAPIRCPSRKQIGACSEFVKFRHHFISS